MWSNSSAHFVLKIHIFFPTFCIEKLMQWWEAAEWSMIFLPLWGWMRRTYIIDSRTEGFSGSPDTESGAYITPLVKDASPNVQFFDRVYANTLETNGHPWNHGCQVEAKTETCWPRIWSNFNSPERQFIRSIYKSVNAHTLRFSEPDRCRVLQSNNVTFILLPGT